MTKDDIIRMAREAQLGTSLTHKGGEQRVWIEGADWHDELERFAAFVAAQQREKVAQWMMARGYATGHGDSIEGLLKELDWQIREQERQACALIAKDWDASHPHTNYGACISNAIRARRNT